jgi:hypothetical protein
MSKKENKLKEQIIEALSDTDLVKLSTNEVKEEIKKIREKSDAHKKEAVRKRLSQLAKNEILIAQFLEMKSIIRDLIELGKLLEKSSLERTVADAAVEGALEKQSEIILNILGLEIEQQPISKIKDEYLEDTETTTDSENSEEIVNIEV